MSNFTKNPRVYYWVLFYLWVPSILLSKTTAKTELQKLQTGKVIVKVKSDKNNIVQINAKIFIPASVKNTWQVLTQYNQLSDYVPHMKKSHVVKNTEREKMVYQKGRTGVFLFYRTSELTMRVEEKKYQRIDFEQIKGDFKIYKGHWQLQRSTNPKGTFLEYHASIKPDFFAPQFVVRYIEKRDIPLVMKALKKEAVHLKAIHKIH